MVNKLNDELTIVSDKKAILGECPVWDSKNGLLYWIDIIGKNIFKINLKNNIFSSMTLDMFVGCVALTQNSKLLVATEKGLFLLNEESLSIELLSNPEENKAKIRFNDGKCDAQGRLWIGTTSYDESEKVGLLYCFEKKLEIRKVLSGIIISNGITWSTDQKTMYYIDSPTRIVKAFDYNMKTGMISDERVAIVFPENEGYPDGMTTDSEDKLWIAHWGAYKVGRWDPLTGKMIDKVDVPVKRVSSVTFGGDNLDELYITTAVRGFSENIEYVDNNEIYGGMLFKIATDVKGIKTNKFSIKRPVI
jgi:sugar lactone lactonase YvrE